MVLELLGHAGGVGSLGFDSDGQTLVSGSGDRTVRMWDTTPSGRGEVGAFQTRFPNEVRFFDGGRRLAVATGGDRHGMQLIEVATGTELRVPEAYSLRVGLSSDETRFAAQIAQVDDQGNQLFGADGTPLYEAAMGVWDTRTGELLQEIPAPGEACKGIQPGQYPTFSHDGRYLAVGYDCESLVRVWDLSSEQLVAELAHEDQMLDVTFAPSDRYLVAVGSGIVRLWDPQDWSFIQDVTPPSAPRLIEFSADGALAATPNEDGTVELWLTEDWSSFGVLSGHRGFVNAVAFNGDGSRVATAGGDQTVRVWDTGTREELWNLTGHNGSVVSVDFHPNDRHIASTTGGPAWTIWIWTLDTDELIEIGEARVTRSLTDRECQIYLHAETCPTD